MSSWPKLSLAANVFLSGLLLLALLRRPPVVTPLAVGSPSPSAPLLADDPPSPAPWTDSISELRRVGVPATIIAKLVVEKVAQKWTPIEAELEQKYLHGEIDARRLAEFHDQRANEEVAELRTALGSAYTDWDIEHTVGNMYLGGLVPAEELKRPLYDLQKSHLARLHAMEVARREGRLAQDHFDSNHAREVLDFKNRLAVLIGPERVDGLAPVASMPQVRADFAQLKLDDTRMRALVDVHEKWSAARAELARSLEQSKQLDSAYEGDLHALDQARDGEYRRVLGNELFDAWQRAGDDRHRAMKENAAAWKLDAPTIASVYSELRAYDLAVANREYQAQLREHAGETVDWAKVQSDVAAYTRVAEASLRAQLGDERFARLSAASIISLREPELGKSALGARPNL